MSHCGKIVTGELHGPGPAATLAEYVALSALESRPSFYAALLLAADTRNQAAQELVQHTREAATETSNLSLFFTLELTALGQLGININRPEFWDRGLQVIKGLLADLQETL